MWLHSPVQVLLSVPALPAFIIKQVFFWRTLRVCMSRLHISCWVCLTNLHSWFSWQTIKPIPDQSTLRAETGSFNPYRTRKTIINALQMYVNVHNVYTYHRWRWLSRFPLWTLCRKIQRWSACKVKSITTFDTLIPNKSAQEQWRFWWAWFCDWTLTLGPGRPASPFAPGSPCSPWTNDKSLQYCWK